jgi:hypothetical protein
MAGDSFTLYLTTGKTIDVDLDGTADDEWNDFLARGGRWNRPYVKVRQVGTKSTYVNVLAITHVDVVYNAPESDDVAGEKARRARVEAGHNELFGDDPKDGDDP